MPILQFTLPPDSHSGDFFLSSSFPVDNLQSNNKNRKKKQKEGIQTNEKWTQIIIPFGGIKKAELIVFGAFAIVVSNGFIGCTSVWNGRLVAGAATDLNNGAREVASLETQFIYPEID